MLWALIAFHAALLSVAPALSQRVVGVGPLAFMLGMPLAVVAYGLRDVVQERWGEAWGRRTVWYAMVAKGGAWGAFAWLGWPEAMRIALAGEAQLLISHGIVATGLFSWLKRRGGPFWARYNLTQWVSMTLGLVIFVVLANAGTARPIVTVVVGGFLLRVLLATALTPMFAALVRVLAVAALISAAPARAADVRVDNVLRQFWADSSAYPWRTEAITTLRWDALPYARPWVNNLLVWDYGSRSVFNDKVTAGVEVWGGLSPAYQIQWVTGLPMVQRVGVEWRLSL